MRSLSHDVAATVSLGPAQLQSRRSDVIVVIQQLMAEMPGCGQKDVIQGAAGLRDDGPIHYTQTGCKTIGAATVSRDA